MIQSSLFDELEAPAPRLVDSCPVCRCCERVDGICLGDCATNGHRINLNGSAPAGGGWVDLQNALRTPYPDTTNDEHDDTDDEETDALA